MVRRRGAHKRAEGPKITYEQNVVILGLSAQVLEDRLLPELLHVGEVLNETVTNGPGSSVRLLVLDGLVTNEAVQVLNTLADGTISIILGGDHGGEDVAGLGVTGISHLGVTGEGQRSATVCVGVWACVCVRVWRARPTPKVCELLLSPSPLLLKSPRNIVVHGLSISFHLSDPKDRSLVTANGLVCPNLASVAIVASSVDFASSHSHHAPKRVREISNHPFWGIGRLYQRVDVRK